MRAIRSNFPFCPVFFFFASPLGPSRITIFIGYELTNEEFKVDNSCNYLRHNKRHKLNKEI